MALTPNCYTASLIELGEACGQTAKALGNLVRAAVGFITTALDWSLLLKAARVQAALNEAPPKVRHLAKHGKKFRTRKKNINRALRKKEAAK